MESRKLKMFVYHPLKNNRDRWTFFLYIYLRKKIRMMAECNKRIPNIFFWKISGSV